MRIGSLNGVVISDIESLFLSHLRYWMTKGIVRDVLGQARPFEHSLTLTFNIDKWILFFIGNNWLI